MGIAKDGFGINGGYIQRGRDAGNPAFAHIKK
jgi:hypothetical protein